jgi:hypothetical protein
MGDAKAAVGCAGAAAGNAAAAATLPAPGGCGDSGVRFAAGSGASSGPEGGGDARFIAPWSVSAPHTPQLLEADKAKQRSI